MLKSRVKSPTGPGATVSVPPYLLALPFEGPPQAARSMTNTNSNEIRVRVLPRLFRPLREDVGRGIKGNLLLVTERTRSATRCTHYDTCSQLDANRLALLDRSEGSISLKRT